MTAHYFLKEGEKMSEFNYQIEKNNLTFKSALTPLVLSKVVRLTLHHMASENAGIETIHQWHLDRGWAGIGYNYFITLDGRIIEGRGLNIGAHASGFNSTSIGIGFQGDYENINGGMPDAQFNAGMWLIKKLMTDISTIKEITGHRDLMSTTCPGQNFPLVEFKGLKYRITGETKIETPIVNTNIYSHMPTLKLCSRGEDVKVLQKLLYELGYTLVGTADGIFGNNTDIAVKQFQSKNQLIADGIVGQNTWTALNKQKNLIAKPIVEEEKVVDLNMYSNMPVLKIGSTGESVKVLQSKLYQLGYKIVGIADGNFGNNTKTAVIQFQLANKLFADGIVGKNTWTALATAKQVFSPKQLYEVIKYDRQTTVVKFKKSDLKKIDVLNNMVGKTQTVKSMFNALPKKPTLMINGGLFDTATGSTLSKFIDEGKIITNGFYSHFAMAIYGDNNIKFEEYDTWKKTGARDVIGGSPSLLINGQVSIDKKGLDFGFINYKHPRLAIGENDTHFFIVVVHGRRSVLFHYGITISGLANLCLKLGMKNAINLDGGGSIMFLDIMGNPINNPLENRGVDNAVCFYLD